MAVSRLLISGNHRGGEFKSNFMMRIEKIAKMCTCESIMETKQAFIFSRGHAQGCRRTCLHGKLRWRPLASSCVSFLPPIIVLNLPFAGQWPLFFIEILWLHERIESTNADIDYNAFLMDMVCSLFLSKKKNYTTMNPVDKFGPYIFFDLDEWHCISVCYSGNFFLFTLLEYLIVISIR